MAKIVSLYQTLVSKLQHLDGVGTLMLRLYLAPIFIIAGYSKLQFSNSEASFFAGFAPDPNIVNWFGNPDWGLGLPMPWFMAFLAAWTEFLGGWLLVLGLATRVVAAPLMITMLVAATAVHWDKGWFAVAPTDPSASAAQVLDWVGIPGAAESLENSVASAEKLGRARDILSEHGNTNWLYENGSIVILNNGIEFSATYFIMCFILLLMGGGRYTSADYWLRRKLAPSNLN